MIIDFKRNFISIADSRSPATAQEKVSFVLELANLGYAVPFEAIDKASKTNLTKALDQAKKDVGADKNWTPMYPNFPKQVIEASTAELFINAILHYHGRVFGLDIRPTYQKELREVLEVIPEDLKVLVAVEEKEIHKSRIATLSNKISLSEADFALIDESVRQYGVHDTLTFIKDLEFPNKENWVATLHILYANGVKRAVVQTFAAKTAKTSTDLLRSIFMLYGVGDEVHIDLDPKGKRVQLGPIPRSVRREIVMTIDERFGKYYDDFYTHRKLWKIVDRKIHPGEMPQFVGALKAFGVVRGTVPFQSYNSRLNEAIGSNVTETIKLLSDRPGVFARTLDHALRSFSGKDQLHIAQAFGEVADKISVPVLISVYNGISNRNNESSVIRTKSGQTANVTNVKAPISDAVIRLVRTFIFDGISKSFEGKPELGKVFVSDELKDIAVPTQVRTASSGRVLPRGSKIDIDSDGNTLRFFVHWYNTGEASGYSYRCSVDLDMDAIFLDENYELLDHVSYTYLCNSYATHSGDITNAPRPKGAAEFIDVDVAKARRHGVRFLVMNINSYSGQPFSEVENYIGFMVRKGDAQKGEIFDPKTVKTAFSSTVPGKNAIPGVFDIVENKFIWLDTSFGQARSGFASWHSAETVAETVKMELDKKALSMYDVLSAHAKARGQVVTDEDIADIVFSTETIDIYDVNGFINEYI